MLVIRRITKLLVLLPVASRRCDVPTALAQTSKPNILFIMRTTSALCSRAFITRA